MNKEVKKIPKQGMYFSDRCQFCGEFGEKIEPYLCEKCSDRIFEWLNSKGWSILQGENRFEPKPDKSRLLTDGEIWNKLDTPQEERHLRVCRGEFSAFKAGAEAQDAKTASIVDKQTRQEMVEYIKRHRTDTCIHRGICFYEEVAVFEIEINEWQELKKGVE